MLRSRTGTPEVRPKDQPVQRYPRALFSVPLTLQYLGPGGIQKVHGISLDISEGGIGALLQHPLRVEEAVGIEFELDGSWFHTVAVVRYSSNVRSGFEFVGLTAEERARLAGLVGQA